ncbi:MAG: polysulfide reductase NrfD [Verrucomicrobia bacterium]|nr:polysulfide reductase NrfD [Verrucomicrobiota bacterium]MCH8512224.1 polysulfide reductase NrfD [Kiritimatiellia bacterium]
MSSEVKRDPDGQLPYISGHDLESVSNKIAAVTLRPMREMPKFWYAGLFIGVLLLQLLFYAIYKLIVTGTYIWGLNIPVGWGFAIINFVWWIGIGHAGTLISAILFLFKQDWRTSISRFAEAMTLFAVVCAGLFPLLHVGRPWLVYWLFPYPNTMGMWPQFRSPLLWDVFAVSTYATVSILFWFTGLVPDLATMRARATDVWAKKIYHGMSLGWTGSARHWHRYEIAYLLLAGLSTPLVLSVHSIVSLDFAVSLEPGWHTTIFPPYFVAGAIFAGFAMVLTFMIPVRHIFGMKDLLTERHLNNMCKVMLFSGLIVAYGYMMELFFGWYSGSVFERFMVLNRLLGPYDYTYWLLILCNVLVPQALWSYKVRTNPIAVFIICQFISVGMWLERFVIVIISLHRDFLDSSWAMYAGTRWDWAMYVGTMGLFLTLVFLFIRTLPFIAIFEMRELIHKDEHHDDEHHDDEH